MDSYTQDPGPMNIYLIYRRDKVYDGQYDSAVVCAETEHVAKNMAPWGNHYLFWKDGSWYYPEWNEYGRDYPYWVHPDQVFVKRIGIAEEGTRRMAILSSFNPGSGHGNPDATPEQRQ